MRKTTTYGIVTGRLLLVAVLLVIRWAIFEPIYFVSTIFQTISDTAINAFNGLISNIQKLNDELFAKAKQ